MGRYIKHAVQEVLLYKVPKLWPYNPGRFSFTFRDAPEAVGRESLFKYFKPAEHLIQQQDWEDQYKKGLIPPLIGAQASQVFKHKAKMPEVCDMAMGA